MRRHRHEDYQISRSAASRIDRRERCRFFVSASGSQTWDFRSYVVRWIFPSHGRKSLGIRGSLGLARFSPSPRLVNLGKHVYLVAMLLGFGLGWTEIAVIVLVVLLIFGPTKLPQLGSSVGKMLRGFKDELKELEKEKAAASAQAQTDEPSKSEIDVTPVEPKAATATKRDADA